MVNAKEVLPLVPRMRESRLIAQASEECIIHCWKANRMYKGATQQKLNQGTIAGNKIVSATKNELLLLNAITTFENVKRRITNSGFQTIQ